MEFFSGFAKRTREAIKIDNLIIRLSRLTFQTRSGRIQNSKFWRSMLPPCRAGTRGNIIALESSLAQISSSKKRGHEEMLYSDLNTESKRFSG
jgi:hypothetical protein